MRKPSARSVRRTLAFLRPEERRGWLSHGLASLAISALGLGVAASVSLTGSAQTTTPASGRPLTVYGQAGQTGTVPGQTQPVQSTTATEAAGLQAFTPRATAKSSRTAAVRAAIVSERVAQRSEDLSETAEDVSRAARDAGAKARDTELAQDQRATLDAAAKLAEQQLRKAIADRLAAEAARKQAESSESPTTTTTPADASPTTTTNIPAGGGAVAPVRGAVIGAHFGEWGHWSRYHTGLDFVAGYGTPIYAVKAGVVLYASNSGDWAGTHVAVKHADGQTTMYSHMSVIATHAGATVRAGEVIGYVGQTGRAFGPHLHFELYPAGVKYGDVYRAINPVPWLNANGVRTN